MHRPERVCLGRIPGDKIPGSGIRVAVFLRLIKTPDRNLHLHLGFVAFRFRCLSILSIFEKGLLKAVCNPVGATNKAAAVLGRCDEQASADQRKLEDQADTITYPFLVCQIQLKELSCRRGAPG